MRDRSQARCVLVQPQVATVLVIVADVSSHEPDEMTCAKNHDVLKELATSLEGRDETGNQRRNHAGMVPADRRLIQFGARG